MQIRQLNNLESIRYLRYNISSRKYIIPGNKRKKQTWKHQKVVYCVLGAFPAIVVSFALLSYQLFKRSSCSSSKHKRLNKYLCSLLLTTSHKDYKGIFHEYMHKDNGNGRVNGSNKIFKAKRKWARCHWWTHHFLWQWVWLKQANPGCRVPAQLDSEGTSGSRSWIEVYRPKSYLKVLLDFQISSLKTQMKGTKPQFALWQCCAREAGNSDNSTVGSSHWTRNRS